MKPSVGRVVHYKLGDGDANEINRRRDDADAFRRTVVHPAEAGDRGRTGHVEHHGNRAVAGDVYPAVVVRTFPSEVGTSNLHVLLDGNDTYWATSRTEGDGEGDWHWPERVE